MCQMIEDALDVVHGHLLSSMRRYGRNGRRRVAARVEGDDPIATSEEADLGLPSSDGRLPIRGRREGDARVRTPRSTGSRR